MFAQMRAALKTSKSTDILDHIYSLPEPDQSEAMSKIPAIERNAMALQRPQPGLTELMAFLTKRKVPKGLCTRNFDLPVTHLLTKFLPDEEFEPVITRSSRPPKPDPAGILHIAKSWELDDGGERLIMVGDSIDDMVAGRRAGCLTVLLESEANEDVKERQETDIVIARLDELIDMLDDGITSS